MFGKVTESSAVRFFNKTRFHVTVKSMEIDIKGKTKWFLASIVGYPKLVAIDDGLETQRGSSNQNREAAMADFLIILCQFDE